MDAWAWIAEQRIAQAMETGFFQGHRRVGRLDLEEDLAVPADQRLAFKVLRDAGFVPPEVELRREIQALRGRMQAAGAPEERAAIRRQIDALVLRVNLGRRRPVFVEPPRALGGGEAG